MNNSLEMYVILYTTHLKARCIQITLISIETVKKPVSMLLHIITIIIHQTHYEKSDWSRAFNQFTIACELLQISHL